MEGECERGDSFVAERLVTRRADRKPFFCRSDEKGTRKTRERRKKGVRKVALAAGYPRRSLLVSATVRFLSAINNKGADSHGSATAK